MRSKQFRVVTVVAIVAILGLVPTAALAETGNEEITASLTQDWVSGSGWSDSGDTAVTLSVNGSELATVVFDHMGPDFRFDTGLDLVPGDLIEATGVESGTTKSLTLVAMTFDPLDVDGDVATGTAPAGSSVFVGVGNEFGEADLVTTADGSGVWVADFGSIGFDITSEMGGFAEVRDADGDGTRADSPPPEPPEPPLMVPSTRDDCKKGGWMNLNRSDGTSFRNQGLCIRYVNTGR